jgi:hypothetical protein
MHLKPLISFLSTQPNPHLQSSLDSIAAQTHVVLSTAGPFALHGTPVVDAAVRSGAHYVDITGEARKGCQALLTRYEMNRVMASSTWPQLAASRICLATSCAPCFAGPDCTVQLLP